MKNLLFSPNGRINRSRFWTTALITSFGLIALLAIVMTAIWQIMPGTVDDDGTFKVSGTVAIPYFLAFLVYIVAAVWSGICLGVKRYHDLDKSGTWMLVMLVPLIGSVIYFIQAGCSRGTTGTNKYGADPLAV